MPMNNIKWPCNRFSILVSDGSLVTAVTHPDIGSEQERFVVICLSGHQRRCRSSETEDNPPQKKGRGLCNADDLNNRSAVGLIESEIAGRRSRTIPLV
ncbi:hypothetical protein GWI33_020312 [Rhynchophorus ferrugineus]|uniref:Uncharacterized protein n=1 Tax=Rhynchophorus ferrugineus TaxID=354439 RepID=A0A834M5W8_RHYFE|nr:hypothetical protein GWI33_020312 [Rhynchophorus ferrugineus]